MNNAIPNLPPRRVRWVALAFVFALGAFTLLTIRDAGRAPVRPAAGGTYLGRDVDGRVVQVCLFEQDGDWQGWLYREGHEQTDWFTTTNRATPWQAAVWVREREDTPKPPELIIASTSDHRRLQATLPRLKSWGNDVAELGLQFEHLKFYRRAGLRFGRMGGTLEFLAQFPRLPESSGFIAAVNREIMAQCEQAATEFTGDPLDFWRRMVEMRELDTGFNEHKLLANWQPRLLTTNLASFTVWSFDETGGNGNHSHWRGVNLISDGTGCRELKLSELFRSAKEWEQELRVRCAPKAKAAGAPDYGQSLGTNVDVDVFTLSSSGLQIYFNPYILGSGADGEFVVHFDYAELMDLLRTDGPAAILPASRN